MDQSQAWDFETQYKKILFKLKLNDLKAKVKSLSGGQRKRIALCNALLKQPELLILDEPCLGLDDINRQLVLALIEKICGAKETSVIYVNHHAQDRILGIDHYLALEKSADNR